MAVKNIKRIRFISKERIHYHALRAIIGLAVCAAVLLALFIFVKVPILFAITTATLVVWAVGSFIMWIKDGCYY